MSSLLKWLLPAGTVAALVLGFSVLSLRAADEPAAPADTGTISGTVKDKDGKAVAKDTEVRLMRVMARRGGGGGGGGQSVENPEMIPLQAGGGGGARGGTPVATAKTDDKGEFKMEKVPVGDYLIRVMLGTPATPEERAAASASANVSVKKGETAKVDLKIGTNVARGGRRGGGGGGGGN